MKLSPMSYKDYVWPHNPRTCKVTARREVAQTKLPGGLWHSGELGLRGRTIKGQGEFSGEGAYESYSGLYKVFCQGGQGLLYHPVLGGVQAYFKSLSLDQEPTANYVSYSFEFEEAGEPSVVEQVTPQAETSHYHTVTAGETFWTILRAFDLSALELVELNPGLSSPADIAAGQILRVG